MIDVSVKDLANFCYVERIDIMDINPCTLHVNLFYNKRMKPDLQNSNVGLKREVDRNKGFSDIGSGDIDK